ncbi:MAG: DUF4255 domain-containing protein, partial [Actinobacteria bacterium]|nr:DUF4255 domain-containing protein [Actinomycetota bacterium]
MIDALDRSLEAFLRRAVPLPASQIDVMFGAPDRDWTAQRNRPTVGLFLYSIVPATTRAASGLRERRVGGDTVRERDLPTMALTYVMTAWVSDPADEHRLLGDLMRTAGAMKKDDLSIFLQKVLDQVGKEDETVDDTSAQNAASIAMKPTGAPKPGSEASYAMKEDVAELFAGQEDLSEDFTERATTLFEAAVNNRVDLEVARIEEEYESKLEEQVSKSIDELHEQVNTYMDYVVEKWMEENAVALENNYRVEATDQFIEGLKGLFAENYVEVPAEKIDMIGDLE